MDHFESINGLNVYHTPLSIEAISAKYRRLHRSILMVKQDVARRHARTVSGRGEMLARFRQSGCVDPLPKQKAA